MPKTSVLKHLSAVNKYFWKYRYRFIAGIFFVMASNYFAVLAPQVTGYIISQVQMHLPGGKPAGTKQVHDVLVENFVNRVENSQISFASLIVLCSVVILLLALIRGLLMFFMRQTIIVMSRHIEYDQKNEVFEHYQKLDLGFYKTHATGDLMNRITEDVSRVRMYVGPAIMYFINLASTIGFCVYYMVKQDAELTLYVLLPLPILTITIYIVNNIIHKKSEKVQKLLSELTTNAQESYSGIRVIKSFVQEKAMLGFFKTNSEAYRKNAVDLAKVEAIFFPSMSLMIGLSTLITILIGGREVLNGTLDVSIIVEFVIYINMLTFPVSALGWTASIIQRAAASQKRLNEFLDTEPAIKDKPLHATETGFINGDIVLQNVSFTYEHTGIKALNHFSLTIKQGQKVLILGRTGSGKSTLAQLLLRFFDPDEGYISVGGKKLPDIPLQVLRESITYIPQDVFLFSDTVGGNISFGLAKKAVAEDIYKAANYAGIDNEILDLQNGYETAVGERGVTLSGGQKQRISIARGLIKKPQIIVLDDCLSAVDTKTENRIINNLQRFLENKTAILITHRIFTVFNFDQVIIMDEGEIIEQGTHEELLTLNGYYAELYRMQVTNQEAVT